MPGEVIGTLQKDKFKLVLAIWTEVNMSALDYYAEARKIATHLKSVGREADGCQLLDAIDARSTGTEILMALRFHLANFLKD